MKFKLQHFLIEEKKMPYFDFLLDDKAKALVNEMKDFMKEEVPVSLIKAMDKDEVQYPRDFLKKLGERNLLGVSLPKKWGGRGVSSLTECAMGEEFSIVGCGLGVIQAMPTLVGEAINAFGTDDQKERFLKPILAGDKVSAEALTEPRGGSDFFGSTTKAELEGDHFIVNGQKRFIVGATEADYFLTFCRTNFEKDAHPHATISALSMENGPGVETEYSYGLMGARGQGTGRLVFRNVKVPKENLIGELNLGALVFDKVMTWERIGMAVAATGTWAALNIALDYSTKRVAFNKHISKFQAVQLKIADSITKLDAARGLIYIAATAKDAGHPNVRRYATEAKKFATQAAWEIVNDAMQIMGGIGYTDVYPIEKMLRDTRLGLIWGGTTDMLNLIIQHDYYQEVTKNRAELIPFVDYSKDDSEKCFTDEDMWKVHEQMTVAN